MERKSMRCKPSVMMGWLLMTSTKSGVITKHSKGKIVFGWVSQVRGTTCSVARETCTLLLDRLVKEGVAGLDQMLASMPMENDDTSRMLGVGAGNEAGVLNSALIRYLDEAI